LIIESIRISWSSLVNKKLRLALTVLGIAIGVAAIVGLLSVGFGMQSAITESMEQFGSDKIMVMAGGGMGGMGGLSGASLESDDLDEIRKIKGVDDASGMILKMLPVKFKDEIKTTYIIGIDANDVKTFFSEMQSFKIADGDFFQKGDKDVVTIGKIVASGLFEKDVKVGNDIYIDNKKVEVTGIMSEIGNPQDDSQIYVPLDTMNELVGDTNELSYIIVKASDPGKVDSVAQDVEDYLDKKYGEKNFMAYTSEQVAQSVSQIFSMISIVLGGIASIALLVAGIGIANTMYMSVMEKTREVGVMKAIGATNKHIMEIFLVESAIIGMLGGLIGIIIGFGVSVAVTYYAKTAGISMLKATVTPELAIGGLLFAVILSMIFGLLPARKASKMNPVDALRYE
jgi:putative ABC transport system permease protein